MWVNFRIRTALCSNGILGKIKQSVGDRIIQSKQIKRCTPHLEALATTAVGTKRGAFLTESDILISIVFPLASFLPLFFPPHLKYSKTESHIKESITWLHN